MKAARLGSTCGNEATSLNSVADLRDQTLFKDALTSY
jgi:hypothetical protein